MKVVDPGHHYNLRVYDRVDLDGSEVEPLIFMKRDSPTEKYPGNVGSNPGTNVQEVLRALINRMVYLNGQIESDYNVSIIFKLAECLYLLELRAAERHGRKLPAEVTPMNVHLFVSCCECGHIFCHHQTEKK